VIQEVTPQHENFPLFGYKAYPFNVLEACIADACFLYLALQMPSGLLCVKIIRRTCNKRVTEYIKLAKHLCMFFL
jgi:hypothetical protein